MTLSRPSPLTNSLQAFENASTNVAAAQMRNALTTLAETVKDPKTKKARKPSDMLGAAYANGPGCSSSRQRWITSLRFSGDT